MKKEILLVLSLCVLGFSNVGDAASVKTRKTVNINAYNVSKAARVISENRDFFNNREVLKKLIELSQKLNTN